MMLNFDIEVFGNEDGDSHGQVFVALTKDFYDELVNPLPGYELEGISRYFSSAEASERFGFVLNWFWQDIYKENGITDFPGWLDYASLNDNVPVPAVATTHEELEDVLSVLMDNTCCVGSGLWK